MPTQDPLHPAHPRPAAGAPAISVVIPVFNGAEYLNRQLRSLADERLSGAVAFEVIVADNGSTDGSVGVAKAWGDRLDLRVIEASERRGQAHARNRGAAAAKTDLLLFLDQDDEVARGYIGHMHTALEHAPFVAARMDPRPLNAGWRLHSRDLAQEHGLAGIPGSPAWAYGCSLGIRRAEFDRLGGFGEALPTRAGEDIDLCWRAAAIGIDLEFVPEAVLHYRFPSTIRGLYP